MSATSLSQAGLKAIEQRNWQDAITKLSKAIEQSKSPAWLLARSQAYLETKQPEKALRDAEFAYCTAAERGNDKSRKQMIEASYRRSVAYFRIKEYANADKLAVWSQRLADGVAVKAANDVLQENVDENGFYHATVQDALAEDKKNQGSAGSDATSKLALLMGGSDESSGPYKKDWNKAQMFRATVLRFLEALPADDPARKVSVKLVPTKPSLEDPKEKEATDEAKDQEIEASKASFLKSTPKPKVDTAGQPFRSQFYQNDSTITATLFMKFASKEDMGKVQVDMQPNLITASGVPREPSTMYIVPHAAIDPTKSTYRVVQMKMEFTLAKASPGKWPSLGREELSPPDLSSLPSSEAQPTNEPTVAPSASDSGPGVSRSSDGSTPSTAPQKSQGPAYPTSSKSGPKDWEKLGDDGDEEVPKDVDQFSQQLFKNSTPEQQRAMMKSYTESNGTSLSTDWASVSKGKVETEPPKGTEAKKWEM